MDYEFQIGPGLSARGRSRDDVVDRRKVISSIPGQQMPRWEAEQIYRSLRQAADEYAATHPEMQIFGAYDTPLAKIKKLLDKTRRRSE